MNISNFIARRYMFAKKSRNVINLISFISFLGLLVSAASLIIILSGFNGIQKYVEDVYGKFAAELYVYPKTGKYIEETALIFQNLKEAKEIHYFSKVIEETALLKFENKWVTCVIKGVDPKTYNIRNWGENLLEGNGILQKNDLKNILLGYGVQNELQIPFNENYSNQIKVFSVSKGAKLSLQNKQSLNQTHLTFGGVYTINPELDYSSAIVSYEVANEIFERKKGANYIEIFLKETENLSRFKNYLTENNSSLVFKTHEENNQLIYAANDTEKWMVLAVLIFVLILSSFTVVASITMLIIDKKKDIKSLIALGASPSTIKKIFFKEGLMISYFGSVGGLLIGALVCLMQIKFHFLKLENAAIDYWPVLLKSKDILMLLVILFSTGFVSAYLPGKLLIRKLLNS